MRLLNHSILAIALLVGPTSGVLAAGNGAGAGGAGFQRSINSGLPPGEPGPLGSVNNPRRPATPPAESKGAPSPEPATEKAQ